MDKKIITQQRNPRKWINYSVEFCHYFAIPLQPLPGKDMLINSRQEKKTLGCWSSRVKNYVIHGHAEWINCCMGPVNYLKSCVNLLFSLYIQYFKMHGFNNVRNYKLYAICLILPNFSILYNLLNIRTQFIIIVQLKLFHKVQYESNITVLY